MKKISAAATTSAPVMILLILLTNVIPPLGIDEYTPSLPYMVNSLHTTVPMLQLTVTVYMLAFAVSQVLGGFLSDRFGRRPVLLWSMPLFIIGSVLCIFAANIHMLLIGRVVQGLGVGVSSLTGPALMADCFEDEELAAVSSYYSTVYSFIPIASPMLGGLIQDYLGWQANFVLLLLLGVLFYLFFYIKLPETHQPTSEHKLSRANIVKNLMAVLSHKKYMLAVVCMLLTWSTIIIFVIMAPFIMQVKLGFSASQYGMQALLVGLGFFLGNSLNNFLIHKMSIPKILYTGLITMIFMSLLTVILPLLILNAWTILIPILLMMIGAGLSFPHLYARAVSAVPEYAGVAGALIGSLVLLGAVIISALVTQLHAHSSVAMGCVYLLVSSLCLIIFRYGEKDSPN